MQHYGIMRDSTIFLSMRLRGGSFGSSSKGTVSFKDVVKGKGEATNKLAPTQDLPGPYIVEQRKKTPVLTINLSEVNNCHADFSSLAVIVDSMAFGLKQMLYDNGSFPHGQQTVTSIYAPKDFLLLNSTQSRKQNMSSMRGHGSGAMQDSS